MKQEQEKNMQQLCCEIGERMVDEAMAIYRQTHKITPEFCVCRCSMMRAIRSIRDHLENGTPLSYVSVSFRTLMESTRIYINLQYLFKQKSINKNLYEK